MADIPRPKRRKSYGWTASIYGAAERVLFGSELMRARTVLLPRLRSANRILILGEGDGRFLQALVKQNPDSTIVVVDRSRRMLARAAKRLAVGPRNVQFIRSDALEFLDGLTPTATFDAVVTLFLLDCLTRSEVGVLVQRGAQKLVTGGAWLWADFFVPPRGLRRPVAQVLLQLLYWFFRATTDTSGTTLIDAAPHFDTVGLRVVDSASTFGGIVHARYMQLGASVKT